MVQKKFKEIEDKLKLEEEIILSAIEKDPENIKLCDENTQNNLDLVKIAVSKNGAMLK